MIEGPDGTGKSTLAYKLAKKVDGMVIHPTFNKTWDMEKYHRILMETALDLESIGISTILDRWAPSEHIYAKVFRGGESFDTKELIKHYQTVRDAEIVWIYCRNDNAAENHRKNMKEREEMFDSMERIQVEFDHYVKKSDDVTWLSTGGLHWHVFDFDKTDTDKFIQKLPRIKRVYKFKRKKK